MNLHHFSATVPPEIGRALARFEEEFTYPLGPHARFRISHGEAYLPFFQAMGELDLCVLEEQGQIVGGLARVARHLSLNGAARLPAHYLCDLKLRSISRGSFALPRLIRETKRIIEASDSHRCYCVVMEGTGKLPTDYTGRLGVPAFHRLGDISVLRLEAGNTPHPSSIPVSGAVFEEVFHSLPRAGYSALGADRSLRSLIEPIFLVSNNGDACAILEDTRRGKRLVLDSGPEMISGHLSRLAFASPGAARRLLLDATAVARDSGLPALFTAIPASRSAAVIAGLHGIQFTTAPAAIYGHALESGHDWWIDTAEI
jgi:hypothetical protein